MAGQVDVLAAFRSFVEREGRSPYLHELKRELGSGSPGLSTLSHHLGALVEREELVRHRQSGMIRYRLPDQASPLSGLDG